MRTRGLTLIIAERYAAVGPGRGDSTRTHGFQDCRTHYDIELCSHPYFVRGASLVISEAASRTDGSTPRMAEHLARALAPRGGAKVLAAPARRGRVYCSRRRMDQSSDGQDVEN